MRLALTAGGTGGHIFPALAVLDALERAGGLEAVRFFGPEDRGERARVEARGLQFEPVPAAAVRGRGPISLAKSVLRLLAGTWTGFRKLRAFQPDVVFSTGGYGSFPCSVAARLLRLPLVVYLPDVTPGWAVSAEKRLATRVATTTEAALEFLPRKKTTVTGYPVRSTFFETSRDEARAQLELPKDAKVLVVAGASQGAQRINRAVFESLAGLAKSAVVFHVTGERDAAEAQRMRAGLGTLAENYRPAAFREDLPLLMVAADLAVMRAGASVLGELPAAGLPSVLIPGTFAGGHQRDNARWLASEGAAVVLEEADLAQFEALVQELLADDARLAGMREAARRLARPDAADAIARVVREVAKR
ncbi:MAG: UDP-N-acetylglucosamine--N-acetylmuramyl-(pentapeptide) pyrophosphoryl-undecaprenol N-acetylglucosamine transferase [Hyphomicrobiales bacterium]